jgi:hypothetical protein
VLLIAKSGYKTTTVLLIENSGYKTTTVLLIAKSGYKTTTVLLIAKSDKLKGKDPLPFEKWIFVTISYVPLYP